MFQIVAVIQKQPRVIFKFEQHFGTFVGHQQHRIFPPLVHIAVTHVVWRAAAFDYLKLQSVDVDWVWKAVWPVDVVR